MSPPSTQPLVTADDQGTIVSVVTWFLLVATTLAVLARVATKLAVARKIGEDDYTIFAALLCSIAQSVATTFQRVGGLGRHTATLSVSELDMFQKSHYTAGLLIIPTLCFAKLSVAFWNYVGVVNILTDLPLLVLPVIIIWSVNVGLKRKIIIFGCFAPRIAVLAAIVTELVYLNRASHTRDPTFDYLPFVVCTQVVQNLSVITACIVYLKPFFESLESGMIRSDLRRRAGKGTSGYDSAGSAGHMPTSLKKAPSRSGRDAVREFRELDGIGQQNHITEVTTAGDVNRQFDWDAGSQRSQSKMIKQTTTWTVDR